MHTRVRRPLFPCSQCTAQDGCADSDTACVTLGGVPKLVCGSPSPGYVVDDNTGAVEQVGLNSLCKGWAVDVWKFLLDQKSWKLVSQAVA